MFERSAVEHVELPSTLKRIEYNAFNGCKDLKSISLPDKLEYIGETCFMQSGFEAVRLSPALKVIKAGTFLECKNLKSVEFPENLEKIEIAAFR